MFLADALDNFPSKSVSLQVTHVNKPEINFQRKEKLAIQYLIHTEKEKKNQHDFPACTKLPKSELFSLKQAFCQFSQYSIHVKVQNVGKSIICIQDYSITAPEKLR